jgi:hypothetical protein
VIARSPPRREAGSEATGYVARQSPPSGSGATVHVVAPEPSLSGGGLWSRWTCGSIEAHLGWEAGLGTTGYVVACDCTPRSLSRLEACTQGYSACMLPIVAPGPTSGEAVNLQVGPTSFFSHAAFLKFHLSGWSGSAPLLADTQQHLVDAPCRSAHHG